MEIARKKNNGFLFEITEHYEVLFTEAVCSLSIWSTAVVYDGHDVTDARKAGVVQHANFVQE